MIKSVWDSMFSEDIMANVFGAGIAAGAILLYFILAEVPRRGFSHGPLITPPSFLFGENGTTGKIRRLLRQKWVRRAQGNIFA